VINKRAAAMGLISGPQGVPEADAGWRDVAHAIQDVYLSGMCLSPKMLVSGS